MLFGIYFVDNPENTFCKHVQYHIFPYKDAYTVIVRVKTHILCLPLYICLRH